MYLLVFSPPLLFLGGGVDYEPCPASKGKYIHGLNSKFTGTFVWMVKLPSLNLYQVCIALCLEPV